LGNSTFPSKMFRKAKFCSLRCLLKAESSYLPIESKVDITEIFYGNDTESQLSGCISLAYRAVTQRGLDFFLQNRNSLFGEVDPTYGTNVKEDFLYSGDEHYRGLNNLVTHYDKMDTKQRMTVMIRSVVLLKCLKESGFFDQKNDRETLTEDEKYIGRLLFHFQCGIQYNLHTVYQVEGQLEATKRIPLQDIGSGCYPTTLFFNHSCAPNTVRINQGPRVIIMAKRNIRAGEEVTDCYGIHHLSMPIKERKETLKRGYCFDCACTGCKKDYPAFAKMPAMLSPDITVKLGKTLSSYKKLFEEEKYQKAVLSCQEYLTKMEDLGVPFPHRNYEISAIALCSCLWAIARYT